MEKPKTRRLTAWAIIMIILGGISVAALGIEEAKLLVDLFKEIIIHLIM